MAQGTQTKARKNNTLVTLCASCGKTIPTDIDDDIATGIETRGLVGYDENGAKKVFPTCTECYEKGWRPLGFVWMN